MSILDLLNDETEWNNYLEYKMTKQHLTRVEEKELKFFVQNQLYLPISQGIQNGSYKFSIPTKKLINKTNSQKKRAVYVFSEEENYILKFITYELFGYDNIFTDNLYSFRRNTGVKRAIYRIIDTKNISKKYVFKLDISNYFNSIDVSILLDKLKNIFANDEKMFNFSQELLSTNQSVFNGQIVQEYRGAMAGTPIASFFANVYLMELDSCMKSNKILYARYSDDIIFFADTQEELMQIKNLVYTFLYKNKLTVNRDKENMFLPGEKWTFLGIDYANTVCDLSSIALQKIMSKIKRKSRAIFRWKVKKNVPTESAIKVFVKYFNKRFYQNDISNDTTWCRWFFPLINTAKSLKIIDTYMLQNIRYLSTGRYCKKNYNVKYVQIKKLGFKSLVNEYYKYKNNEDYFNECVGL